MRATLTRVMRARRRLAGMQQAIFARIGLLRTTGYFGLCLLWLRLRKLRQTALRFQGSCAMYKRVLLACSALLLAVFAIGTPANAHGRYYNCGCGSAYPRYDTRPYYPVYAPPSYTS